ncbi:MAG: LysM peptidoglycan-binding domain-containing protein [Candidatus Limnocylindrales bacterium]
MSGRAAEPVEIPPACPFLAFEDDREHRSTLPDHRHRCYAETRPAPRATAHQERYCLTSDFPTCPTFQAWARRESARETAPDAPRQVAAGRPPADPGAWLRDEGAAGGGAAGGAAAAGPAQLGAFDAPEAGTPGAGGGPGGSGDPELAALVGGAAAGAATGAKASSAGVAGDAAPVWTGAEDVETPAFLAGRASGAGAGATGGAPPPTSAAGRTAPRLDTDAPAWETPRRFEAYPTLRTRAPLPSVPPVALALLALVLAAVILFLLPGFFAGGPPPGSSGSPSASSSASSGASAEPTTPPAPTPLVYIVKPGDTLTKIATKFGVTVTDLLAANPQIKDANKIAVGDPITIPTAGASPSAGRSGSP